MTEPLYPIRHLGTGELRVAADEDVLDAFRSGQAVTLNAYGELYELTPEEADELGMQLIWAAARTRDK